MSIKLAAKLPQGDQNGLGAIAAALCDNPEQVHVAVVLLDCSKITTDTDNGDVIPTARIRAIEPINGTTADAKEMRRLIRRAYERRTGQVELPLEMEHELSALSPNDDDGM